MFQNAVDSSDVHMGLALTEIRVSMEASQPPDFRLMGCDKARMTRIMMCSCSGGETKKLERAPDQYESPTTAT